MKSTYLRRIWALPILLVGTAQAIGSWERIDVQLSQYDVTVGTKQTTVSPGCALGEPYSFHFKGRKDEKLLIYYNGGGACWDNHTCIGSLTSELPAYVPSDEIANDPAQMGGILDFNNPDNPYADWSMLFISYCTGDVHVGSTDTVYLYPPGSNNQFPIRHRGFDNFLYAMDWLRINHSEIVPGRILTAGSSAGSYGAAFNYPWVHEFYPDADKMFLVGDGGVGVLTYADDFVNAVLGASSVWNLNGTLHPVLASLPDSVLGYPESLMPETYRLLGAKYPKDKFAQYTTAYDTIQVLFWDIMLNPNDPSVWGNGLSYLVYGWNSAMNEIQDDLIDSLPDNYRSYIEAGCNHTIFRDDNDFYTSSLISASDNEISFIQWLSGMTGEKHANKHDWQNLSCTPLVNCGELDLNPEGIAACMSPFL